MRIEDGPLDVLWENGERLYRRIWRDMDDGGSHEFLVAQLCAEHLTPGPASRLAHEYGLREFLDHPWAVRPLELLRERGQTMLVFESTTARPLENIIGQGLPVGTFLRLAIAATHAVAGLHHSGLIHKDIKATNILIDPETGDARLTGFGFASRLPRERQILEQLELIAGTLSHMAPEQTGRMNRSVDSRSDLYSLGITLYQAITGSLPFSASEPMEWVHCHIARKPAPPTARRKEIPPQLSVIVMKLLAKAPEERYQTAAGVEHDLRRCLDDWETQGAIAEFLLGERDHSNRLLIPEKLYGREREIETLLAAFDGAVASAQPHLVLVSGHSGIGKSSVVGEMHKALVPPRGLFAFGKFDQLKRDVPYATLAQACRSLIRQLLGKPEAELTTWREQLRQALNPNGVLLLDLIPELKFVIGEQPVVPELPRTDAKARFQMTLRRLIGVFARAEHPLALFLDDLQWLDGATLDLLENILVQPEPQHLLLVGAYRDNEVDAAHPLTRKLSAIRESGAVIPEIVLEPLSYQDLTLWLADALRCPTEEALTLAQLVHEKTAGNPFFANQFLQELVDGGLITFEPGDARWHWELGPIRIKGYSDNVVDLMIDKLSRLPMTTREALKSLAYLGNMANASTLAMVHGESDEQLHSDLWEALRLELIVRSDDSYRFVHDRVQEAAYSLVPEEQRAAGHLRIGRLLTARTAAGNREESVFDIVGHFNRGSSLITSRDEREQVAAFNLLAGKRAKKSAAFASALSYLVAGAALVESDGWRRHDLVFELELHRAECELLTGDIASAETRLRKLSSRTLSVIERCSVGCLQTDVYVALQESYRGLSEGIECLRQVGLDIPLRPTEAEARVAYDGICSKLDGVGINDVAGLPMMTDPASAAILDLLTALHWCAGAGYKPTQVVIGAAAVDFVLERGLHESASWAFEHLGYLAAWFFDDFEGGFRFAQLGYELIDRAGLHRFEGLVCLHMSTLVMPWSGHVTRCRPVIRRTFEVAHSTGNRFLAVAGGNILLSNLLLAGDPLVEVEREAEFCLAFCRMGSYGNYTDALATQAALVRTLRGLTPHFGSFDDEQFSESRIENDFATQPHVEAIECWYWIRKLQVRFLAGSYAAAHEASLHAQRLLAKSPGMLERAEHELYSALTRAAMCHSPLSDEGQQHLEAISAHHQQLKVWARYCPENFENRAALVAAELARIEGRDLDATQLYEQAIRSSRENGFVHHEALALELAAQFYSARGFDRIAKAYLRDARSGYRQWGADGKVWQLEAQYPYLSDAHLSSDPTRTVLAAVEHLDLSTVLRLSQAVQGETDLEMLTAAVMRLALEHAGAERGLLILPQGDAYRIEAEARSGNEGVTVDLRQTSIEVGDLPQSVLQYVLRTRERVLLQDASTSNGFADDEYLRKHDSRSVLCIPLLKQTRLTGLIYLENNLTSGAFTPARMALLEVLASDAAISLENARLYRDLQVREARVRRLIDANIIGISIWQGDGGILDANEEFLRIVGYDREDLVSGRVRWTDLTPPEGREVALRALDKLRAGGDQKAEERELLRKDGSRVPVLVGGTTFEGVLDEGLGFMIDLTDRKRDEAEIRALKEQLYRENLALRDEVDRASMFEEIVGASQKLKAVLFRIAKVAPTDSTVFISGETGTGKELVARAVHKRSQRSGRAFVSVNCAALAPTLISSELFGHEKGAFTGATQRRLGRFELADGGTIFLDEVGELLPDTQVMLLRVLQEREFERVGGTQSVHVDVRVIAATNRDLEAAIANGSFRQDLYYRLNVFPVEMPPLRERKDDLLMLVEYFVQRYASRAGKHIRSIDKRTLDLLQAYDWPGNIRELQNVIERSVILSSGSVFAVDELWLSTQSSQPTSQLSPSAPVQADRRSERDIIEAALAESRGRISGPSGAAARLNIPASTLEFRIKSLNIRKSQFKFGGSPREKH